MLADLVNFFDCKFQINICSKLSTHKSIKEVELMNGENQILATDEQV